MTSELAKQHTKFDEFVRKLEADPMHREGLERAREDMRSYLGQMKLRYDTVYAALRDVLIEEFRENLEIKAPGPLADSTAKALMFCVSRMLNDGALTTPIPMSTETKVEM